MGLTGFNKRRREAALAALRKSSASPSPVNTGEGAAQDMAQEKPADKHAAAKAESAAEPKVKAPAQKKASETKSLRDA